MLCVLFATTRTFFHHEDDVGGGTGRCRRCCKSTDLLTRPSFAFLAGGGADGDCPPCFNCLLPAFNCGQVSVSTSLPPVLQRSLLDTVLNSSANVTRTMDNVDVPMDGEDKIV
jgi:hypothetical protein